MKSFLFHAASIFAAGTLSAQSNGVWSASQGGNGHLYEVVSQAQRITWTDARAAAEARGGHLATITSAAENSFIYGLGSPNNPWIGGFQSPGAVEPAGGWNWVTNEPFTYTNWFPGSPGHEAAPGNTPDFGGEDKLEFYQSLGGTWNDLPNSHPFAFTYSYVVEYGAPQTTQIPHPPTPTTAPALAAFPSAAQLHNQLPQFLSTHGNEFSTDSQSFLTTTVSQLGPLADPNSDRFLKDFAGDFALRLNGVVKTVGTINSLINLSPQNVDRVALSLGLTWLGPELIPNERDRTIAKTLSSAASIATASNPVSALVTLNTWIYGTLVVPKIQAFANDPFDPNFQSVVGVGSPFPATLPTTGNVTLDAAFRQQIDATTQIYLYLQAANTSFDRYASALQMGDTLSAGLQLEALLNFLKLYDEAAQTSAATTTQIQDLLVNLGYGSGAYDPQTLAAVQAQLSTNGFSAETSAFFSDLGLSQQNIDGLRSTLLALDPNSFSGTLSAQLGTQSSEVMGGTSVPEPSTSFLLISALSLISASRFRRATNGT